MILQILMEEEKVVAKIESQGKIGRQHGLVLVDRGLDWANYFKLFHLCLFPFCLSCLDFKVFSAGTASYSVYVQCIRNTLRSQSQLGTLGNAVMQITKS